MNISSVVVKCASQFLEGLLADLKSCGACDVYSYDQEGRIVIILEGETTEEESEKLRIVSALPHVLSAEMVYAYSESEFSAEEGKFEKVSDELLTTLNSDMRAEDIVYRGHLKDK